MMISKKLIGIKNMCYEDFNQHNLILNKWYKELFIEFTTVFRTNKVYFIYFVLYRDTPNRLYNDFEHYINISKVYIYIYRCASWRVCGAPITRSSPDAGGKQRRVQTNGYEKTRTITETHERARRYTKRSLCVYLVMYRSQ